MKTKINHWYELAVEVIDNHDDGTKRSVIWLFPEAPRPSAAWLTIDLKENLRPICLVLEGPLKNKTKKDFFKIQFDNEIYFVYGWQLVRLVS